MYKTLIRQLNQLNHQFYQQVATSFSNSRSYYWQGWNKLVPYLQELAQTHQQKLTVLDIGCGNGRFGAFVAEQLPSIEIEYIGLDNSKELLKIAQTQSIAPNIKTKFIQLDIVESLLNDSFEREIRSFASHFVTTLGVIHHIPSLLLRQQFITKLAHSLTSPGYLAFTTWNFLDTKRFQKKIIEPSQVKLNAKKLEKHDVILDWKRGGTAFRYCHYTDPEELEILIQNSKLEQVSQFKADGKSGKLNTYSILKKG